MLLETHTHIYHRYTRRMNSWYNINTTKAGPEHRKAIRCYSAFKTISVHYHDTVFQPVSTSKAIVSAFKRKMQCFNAEIMRIFFAVFFCLLSWKTILSIATFFFIYFFYLCAGKSRMKMSKKIGRKAVERRK